MGYQCTGTCWLTAICVLQLITIAVRQTFDFLGLQWTAILVNFCQTLAVIIGLYAIYRRKPRLVAVYSTWILIWIGWNIFVMFVYLSVGGLKLDEDLMSMNLGMSDSYTWFKTNNFNCSLLSIQTIPNSNPTEEAICFLDYHYIEVFQSGLQLLLAVISFSISCYVIGLLRNEEDELNSVDCRKQKNLSKSGQSQPLVGAATYDFTTA